MDALLLGRQTYDNFAGHWPAAPADIPFTGLLNGVDKYVASRTLSDPLDWSGSTVLTDPVPDAVAALTLIRHENPGRGVGVIVWVWLVGLWLRAAWCPSVRGLRQRRRGWCCRCRGAGGEGGVGLNGGVLVVSRSR